MGIINKIKGWFFNQEESKQEEQVEETPIQEVPQPKGEIIAMCSLCGLAIGSEDRVRNLNGASVHKRCAKKAMKSFMRGEAVV
jgi:hypothetical protein